MAHITSLLTLSHKADKGWGLEPSTSSKPISLYARICFSGAIATSVIGPYKTLAAKSSNNFLPPLCARIERRKSGLSSNNLKQFLA